MRRILAGAVIVAALFFAGRYLLKPSPVIRNAHPLGENIICFGDSLTYGTGAHAGMDYPAQLSRLIGLPVLNQGVPGDTTERALLRLKADVLSQSPAIVLLTLGGNDLKNGVSRETAFENLRQIVAAIQAEGALVAVGGIAIPLYGRGFADAYRELCDDMGAVLVPDIYDGILGNAKMMSDPIHPNDAGYGAMAQHFREALKPYLASVRKPAS